MELKPPKGFASDQDHREKTATLLFTVITPCFNVAKVLPRYFNGIINQSFRPFECILINDGSTDNTGDVIEQWFDRLKDVEGLHARLYSQSNKGPFAAVNLGLAAASGEFIVFCDADDELMPQALAEFSRAFNYYPDADLIFTRYEICDWEGKVLEFGPNAPIPNPENVFESLLARGMFIKAGAFCFRRACLSLLPLGRLNEEYYGQNLEILLNVAAAGRVHFWDATTVRIHWNTNSRSRTETPQAVYRQVFDSKRTHLEAIRRYGCSRRTWRAFRLRFLSREAKYYYLTRNVPLLVWCFALSIWLGRPNFQIFRLIISAIREWVGDKLLSER
jgi:glycosyltransferase involved in cell wall biosynthesis